MVELWAPAPDDVLLLAKNADFEDVRAAAAHSTFSMTESMLAALAQRRTTLEELIRTIPYRMIGEFRQRQSLLPTAATA